MMPYLPPFLRSRAASHTAFSFLLAGLTAGGARAQVVFEDATAAAGLTVTHQISPGLKIGTGAAWFDYDGDGDLDLYMTQRTGANLLFENQLVPSGTATFVDVAALRGAEAASFDGGGVAVADYDNDGDYDLYLANGREDAFLRNELTETGSPNFTDITVLTGIDAGQDQRGTSASWGDYDGDGYLDLYVANHASSGPFDRTQDHLYHNDGDGTFTDVSALLMGDVDGDGTDDLEGTGFIAGWTDFDNDGDLDIHLMNDYPFDPEGNKLWRNDGGSDPLTWTFTEVSPTFGLPFTSYNVNAMGIAMGDYDRDGFWDYFYTDIGSATLIRNNGDGTFTDVTDAAGLFDRFVPGTAISRVTWGTVFVDYDLDGWQDLVVAAGALSDDLAGNPQPNLLYHNEGDGTFTDVSAGNFPASSDSLRGRTIVMGDYDADGDPDLFLVNYDGPAVLLRNRTIEDSGGTVHWLQVEVHGSGPPLSNLDGVGAKVKVTTPDGVVQHYEIRSGSSLGGGDDLAAYFGVGSNTVVSEVEVTWPTGQVQTLTNVAADQRLVVNEEVVRSVTLTSPNGGEVWEQGTTQPITWTSTVGGNMRLTLFKGEQVDRVIASSTPDDGSFDWVVPNDADGADYQVRILSHDDNSLSDNSDGFFSIVPPGASFITVTSPNGGEVWAPGSLHDVTWTSNIVGNVRILLYKNGVLDRLVAGNTEGDGLFEWTVPTDADGADYQIRVASRVEPGVADNSDGFFSILSGTPSITVTAPNGGEVWEQGTTQPITWTSNVGGTVRISLYNGAAFDRIIVASTPDDGQFDWLIPTDAEGADYQVRVLSRLDPSISDLSDAPFSIVAPGVQASRSVAAAAAVIAASAVPDRFALAPSYPNPFNPATVIAYDLASEAPVSLVVYDVLGRQVRRLANRVQAAGRYRVRFEAGDLPGGVYLVLLQAGAFQASRTMVLLR